MKEAEESQSAPGTRVHSRQGHDCSLPLFAENDLIKARHGTKPTFMYFTASCKADS